ncbi:molybdate ABC transporter substrate-binding protein [Lysinibacillus sp. NPDC096418]|uniref:molybdate ABC transporter substrate-binding protein n=1 Tax=Lysinibacillus sp. NPDC096418 TaxID=3364138 RepID=UPI0037F7427A
MKKFNSLFASLLLLVGILAGCGNQESNSNTNEQVELTISAAASLQESLEELQKNYEKEHSTIKITYNFGGSGALQQQISQGAPVDLFFSAAEDKFDELVSNGAIDQKQGTDLLANELVLVVPKKNEKHIQSFEDLKNADKIAIGTPETVPAGKYGVETLQNMDIWEELQSKVVYTKDVRQVLTYTETENVDAGIVYKTDALVSEKVDIVATAKEDTHTPIIYPVGVIKDSKHIKEAEDFYNYLQSDEALKVFKKYGFQGAH